MKNKFALLVILCLFSTNVLNAQNKVYGFEYDKNIANSNYGKNYFVVTRVMPDFPADKSGLKLYDVIIRINDIETSTMKTLPITINTMEVCRLGQQEVIKITMLPSVDYPKDSKSERRFVSSYSFYQIPYRDEYLSTNKAKVNVYIDPEEDLMDFYTFDFDYTYEENPALEKQIANIIQKQLEERGLIRDKEHPDMLIFMNFYSGTKESYVAPTQNVSTRYKTEYNFWTKRHENNQYIESNNSGGYTYTTYLYLFQLSFLNAKKAQKPSTLAPIIWRGDFEYSQGSKPDNIEMATRALAAMFYSAYPYKVKIDPDKYKWCYDYNRYGSYYDYFPNKSKRNNNIRYYYTGLHYNHNNGDLQQITFVDPDSPADKAGIKAKDIVTKINGITVQKKYNWRKPDPFVYIRDGEESVTFEIKRGKEKLIITIRKEERMTGLTW